MYGGSAGKLLVVLHVLSAGILIDSGLPTRSMLKSFSRRCTDNGLTINVKCRTKPKNMSRNNRLASSVNRTNVNRCCLVNHRIASDDDEETDDACVQSTHKRNRRASKDPATRRIPSCTTLELRVCLGDEAHFLCEVSGNITKALISWKTPDGDVIVRGPSLVVPAVRRQDGGVYVCEVADILGSTLLRKKLRLIVQFPPVITVPNQYSTSSSNPSSQDRRPVGHLSCTAEAVPSASLMWYKDSVPIVDDNTTYQSYSTTSERTHCVTSSSLFFRRSNDGGIFLNFSTDQSEIFYGNYTCTATNDYGFTSRLFSFYGFSNEEDEEEEEIRKFNVTGFIIGMLPPIFISVYIILKLGYRSRYAEERPEDDGMREEPFFISY